VFQQFTWFDAFLLAAACNTLSESDDPLNWEAAERIET